MDQNTKTPRHGKKKPFQGIRQNSPEEQPQDGQHRPGHPEKPEKNSRHEIKRRISLHQIHTNTAIDPGRKLQTTRSQS